MAAKPLGVTTQRVIENSNTILKPMIGTANALTYVPARAELEPGTSKQSSEWRYFITQL